MRGVDHHGWQRGLRGGCKPVQLHRPTFGALGLHRPVLQLSSRQCNEPLVMQTCWHSRDNAAFSTSGMTAKSACVYSVPGDSGASMGPVEWAKLIDDDKKL